MRYLENAYTLNISEMYIEQTSEVLHIVTRQVTVDGYWIVNWIYWITVGTLYNTTQGWQRLFSLCSTATNSAEYLANTNCSGLQTRLTH
jgi:hypothetical protein